VRRLELEVEGDRVANLHGRGLKETKFDLTGTEVCGYVVKFGLYPQLAKMRIGTEGRRFAQPDVSATLTPFDKLRDILKKVRRGEVSDEAALKEVDKIESWASQERTELITRLAEERGMSPEEFVQELINAYPEFADRLVDTERN
jgi:hypothetical protein